MKVDFKTVFVGLFLVLIVGLGVYFAGGSQSVVGVQQVPGEFHIGDTLRHKFVLFCDDQSGCFGVRASTQLLKPSPYTGTVNTVSLNKDFLVSSDGIGFSGTSDSFDSMLPYTHIVTVYAKDFTLFDSYPVGQYTLYTVAEYKTATGVWKQAFVLSESVNVLAKPVSQAPVVSPPPAGASPSPATPAPVTPAPVVVAPSQPAPIVQPTPGCTVMDKTAGAWSACAGGLQARIVSDNCGGKVQESQECFSFPAFRWDYAIVVGAAGLLLVVFAVSGKKRGRRR